MAKKKTKFSKVKFSRLRRDKRFVTVFIVLIFLVGVATGLAVMALQPFNAHPKSLVWAAEKDVEVPKSLVEFLQSRNDCHDYRGTNTADGVTIWSVYQTAQSKFAKMSYGCSTNLTLYIVAVKEKSGWRLLQPTDYFSGALTLPKCSMIDTYQIPKTFESFCVNDDGTSKENKLP